MSAQKYAQAFKGLKKLLEDNCPDSDGIGVFEVEGDRVYIEDCFQLHDGFILPHSGYEEQSATFISWLKENGMAADQQSSEFVVIYPDPNSKKGETPIYSLVRGTGGVWQ